MTKLCPSCGQRLPVFGRFTLIEDRGAVEADGKSVRLTKTQFVALKALADNVPRVVTKYQIHDALYWNRAEMEEPNIEVIGVLICHVRKKIGPLGLSIKTHWGRGYQLVAAAESENAA